MDKKKSAENKVNEITIYTPWIQQQKPKAPENQWNLSPFGGNFGHFSKFQGEYQSNNQFLGGGNSNIFYFHPETLGKWSNLTSIFFKWVG